MKTRTRELAKPGIYGTVEDPQVVTERDLREIAETFPEVTRAPVSLSGHWLDPSKPRLGNVISVSFDEKTKVLSGVVEEQDALAEAVDAGYFPDCSLGSKRRAIDSKMYLHHLAYLGEVPPAIKDLVKGISETLEGKPDIAASEEDKSIIMLPPPSAKQLALSDGPNSKREGGATAPEEDPVKIEEENAELKLKLADLETRNRETLKAGLRQAMEGRIPKARHADVLALADTLGLEESIELSDEGSAAAKKKVSGLEALRRIIEAIPRPVTEGRLELSDGDAAAKPLDLSRIKGKF